MFCLFLLLIMAESGDAPPVSIDFRGSPPIPDISELGLDTVLAADSSIAVLQERILQWYLEEGYPFAGAGFFFPSADTLVVNMVPGRHASLEEVRIEGAPGTRPEVFTRLLSMKPGDIYDREAVDSWLRRLERLKFLDQTGATVLFLGELGNLVLIQNLQEGCSGHFAAAMGWNGEDLEGGGEVLFLNLAGTARELEISAHTTGWGGLNASLRYREPWLFGIPLSLELEAAQDTPESSWVNREASLSIIWEMYTMEVKGGAGIWRGYPPDGSREEYDYGLAGILYRAGRRVPQGWQGINLQFEARAGNRTGRDTSGVLTMAEAEIRGDWFKGFMGLGGELLTGGVMQGDWFEGLLRQLGGQQTLRGYPDNAFRAVRYIVGRPELSIGETETRIYLFCDMAAIETPEDIMRYPAGCGAGMRGTSGIFLADAAAGFPIKEGLGSARLYLRIMASL
ncbi:MAG: hypothetical protein KAW14_06675 [Candidatus Aegiribacteria sp.]|nr:hypothetical protein [Candidatus Aegiribacteria sp.]